MVGDIVGAGSQTGLFAGKEETKKTKKQRRIQPRSTEIIVNEIEKYIERYDNCS